MSVPRIGGDKVGEDRSIVCFRKSSYLKLIAVFEFFDATVKDDFALRQHYDSRARLMVRGYFIDNDPPPELLARWVARYGISSNFFVT